MGLWHDIHAADSLLRAGTHVGGAAEAMPVTHGVASDNQHVEHIDTNPHVVPGFVAYPDDEGVWYESVRTDAALLDYAQDFEAGEDLIAEFGDASDWDEPFAPEPLPFRSQGWADMAECAECGSIGLYGVEHRGCGGLFTIIYR